jgi:hypothetical protein
MQPNTPETSEQLRANLSMVPEGVYVLGLGVKAIAHITLETHRIVQELDYAVYMDSGTEVQEYLDSMGVNGLNVMDWYQDGQRRQTVYEAISDHIVEKASSLKRVGYLAPGNPIFLNSIVTRIEKQCREKRLPYFLLASVSSIDTIINDLRIPIGDVGLQCFDATTFGRLRPNVDISVPLMLFDPALFNTPIVKFREPPVQEAIIALQKLLLEIYKPDARWILVSSAGQFGDASRFYWDVLKELHQHPKLISIGTLVLPGGWWPEMAPVVWTEVRPS